MSGRKDIVPLIQIIASIFFFLLHHMPEHHIYLYQSPLLSTPTDVLLLKWCVCVFLWVVRRDAGSRFLHLGSVTFFRHLKPTALSLPLPLPQIMFLQAPLPHTFCKQGHSHLLCRDPGYWAMSSLGRKPRILTSRKANSDDQLDGRKRNGSKYNTYIFFSHIHV